MAIQNTLNGEGGNRSATDYSIEIVLEFKRTYIGVELCRTV